jgi:hypothetical protein
MVCELKIRQMEKNLGRKLTPEEKKEIEEKMGHVEIENKEEIEVVA